MPSTGTILSALGVIFMLHSAFSCLHYRNLLQELDLVEGNTNNGDMEDISSSSEGGASTFRSIPPMDVYIEVLFAFFLLLAGQLSFMGSLQPVEVGSTARNNNNYKPLSAPVYKTRDFDIYEHRGKDVISKSSKGKLS